jgi:GT2 family glycosyltransferase
MKQPFVTILVTVGNNADTIAKCIDSLLALDYKNKKIYVTDAYSTDGTWEILKGYSKKIRLERVKGNIAAGHNHMIRRVNTDLIAFTDADCTVDKKWLTKLVKAISSPHVVASAGYIRTPKGVNKLQNVIGKELEDRFKKFPRYISRAPTMNLCVRTAAAKKVPFDERFDVAQETDWGYRLTKLGKMIYQPAAIVYHYHRATWKKFFKQQYMYAMFAPYLYVKHKRKTAGDHITKFSMIIQPFLFLFCLLFLVLSLLASALTTAAILLLIFLFAIYLRDTLRLSKSALDVVYFLAMFAVRTIAWGLGLLHGIVFYLSRG